MRMFKSKEAIYLLVAGGLLFLAWVFSRTLAHLALAVDLLTLSAAVIGGIPIAVKAVAALRRKRITVDTLVVTAATAAILIGDFWEAGLVIVILLLGEFLEGMTVTKTGQAIRGLASLIPNTVMKKEGETEVEIATADVKVADVIVVRPGERIAIDGVIAHGAGTIDNSLVTGEAIPVEASVGDEVYSGTILAEGAIDVLATRVGGETTVAKIKRMISESMADKAPMERTVDKFARYFVPTVFLLAGLVYIITLDIRRAITVLVVACPCALVLGTPTAVVAAIGAAARRGILIKGGRALETAGKITAVVFDKTGTLTHGSPKVVEVNPLCASHDKEQMMELAAIAEKLSEHPLAAAVIEQARDWDLAIVAPDDFKVKRGQGVVVWHNGVHIVVGNRSLLADNGIALSTEIDNCIKSHEGKGRTVLVVAHSNGGCQNGSAASDSPCCEKEICGTIALADTIKEEAASTVQTLQSLKKGTHVALYTGDNRRTAAHIADLLNIDEVEAELFPEDKTRKVSELMAAGHKVAMVGDGINDAPALAAADLGIAMGVVGADIAVQAADVAILNDAIASVPKVFALGKRALWVIRQNIFFALLFNTGMIGLAALGLISLVVAAVFHSISSFLVILNSMRLLWVKSR